MQYTVLFKTFSYICAYTEANLWEKGSSTRPIKTNKELQQKWEKTTESSF